MHLGAAVLELLARDHGPLKEAGYTHTVIPDRNLTVYNNNGASIEVIWFHRREDESGMQRLAGHFELARSEAGWRVVGIQGTATARDSLAAVWRK